MTDKNTQKEKKNLAKNLFNDVFVSGNIVEHKKLWFTLPLVVVFIAIVVFCSFWIANKSFGAGMNIGIDFTGGNIVTVYFKDNLVQTNKDQYVEEIYQIVRENGGDPASNQIVADTGISVRYPTITTDGNEAQQINIKIENAIREKFGESIDERPESISTKNIGPTASRNLILAAFVSLIVALAIILIYVAIRFKLWSGIASCVALLHDVILMIALTVICRIQVNTYFVAAIITIVAYSINNSIVVFDRIRENDKINESQDSALTVNQVVNLSVKQTLRRSLNTTVTTLFSILLLAIIGVPQIREFALPIIFGLLAGFFSSLVVAPSLYCVFMNAVNKRKLKQPLQKKQKTEPALSTAEKTGGKKKQ